LAAQATCLPAVGLAMACTHGYANPPSRARITYCPQRNSPIVYVGIPLPWLGGWVR
jgi:hypothetical protein